MRTYFSFISLDCTYIIPLHIYLDAESGNQQDLSPDKSIELEVLEYLKGFNKFKYYYHTL